jgi:hypothetical protein
VFEGEGSSKAIEYATGERYSHAGVIERGADGKLYLREAQMGHYGSKMTPLKPGSGFDLRAYSVVGRGTNLPATMSPGSFRNYNLAANNCVHQAAYFSGLRSANNPGVFQRINY